MDTWKDEMMDNTKYTTIIVLEQMIQRIKADTIEIISCKEYQSISREWLLTIEHKPKFKARHNPEVTK